MHIGVDLQTLRWPEGGVFFHAWSLFSALKRVNSAHQITPLLYGHRRMVEADAVRRFEAEAPPGQARYYWEGPDPFLLSRWFQNWKPQPPWVVRQIDRRLCLPAWTRSAKNDAVASMYRFSARLGVASSPFYDLDIVHHFNYIILPIHSGLNVLTIADLTTLRVPQFHTQGTRDWQKSAYTNAPRMDLIITSSEHCKRDVTELLQVTEEKVRVTPLAAHEQYQPIDDTRAIDAVRAKHEIAERPYIIMLATLEPRKNHCRLIEAFHQVRAAAPELNHRLVLVGAKGWLYEPIFETIERLGLAEHVRWLNYVPFEDLPFLLNGAEAFVYPSLYEGFGLPPLEAMACGVPVIASNTTSLPEVVGDAGLLVDPLSVDAIALAIRQLLNDSGLRARLRDAGLNRAKQFSWDKTAQLTLAAYEDAWKRRQHTARNGKLLHVDSAARQEVQRWVILKSIEYAKKVVHPIGF